MSEDHKASAATAACYSSQSSKSRPASTEFQHKAAKETDLHVSDEALQKRPAAIGQHCDREAFPCDRARQAQPVPST